jgi:SAM-dependent methyltransferase
MNAAQRFAPATARNRKAILEVLRRWVAPGANVLEIASGSGEHAVFLAPGLEVASWQPSDPDLESRSSIDAWREDAAANSVLPAVRIDVTDAEWPSGRKAPNVIACINMIHIAPWRAALGLFDGAGQLLEPGGILYLYGPYRREGHPFAPSNAAFDASLRERNPEWGVRALEEVVNAAALRGFELAEVVEMPANNLSVILKRQT